MPTADMWMFLNDICFSLTFTSHSAPPFFLFDRFSGHLSINVQNKCTFLAVFAESSIPTHITLCEALQSFDSVVFYSLPSWKKEEAQFESVTGTISQDMNSIFH